jgi:cilia- and flagella-associated protein 57
MHHPKEGSLNYVCHAWMQDTARIVVCTEAGDIMVCENSGEFYTYVERDERQKIKCIVPYNRGFVLGYSNGMFTAYERYEDSQSGIATYRRFKEVQTQLEQPYQLTSFPVSSMVLTSTEDQIYFVTENNQLLKVNFAMDGLDEHTKFEYVICNFHSQAVTGMDVCIRKQLVVTCSKDKTIRIWNYANRTLEIVSGVLSDETLAVAFHPSGFHVICALLDKISIYNVLG